MGEASLVDEVSDRFLPVGWLNTNLRPRYRIIQKEGSPVWEETTALLVGMNELNAREAVMLQVWDSGMWTACLASACWLISDR